MNMKNRIRYTLIVILRVSMVFLFLFVAMNIVYAKKKETKIEYLNRKGLVNQILNMSYNELNNISSIDDLKLLGLLFNQNGLFKKSIVVYERLKQLKKDDFETIDVLNYYQALIETNRFDVNHVGLNLNGANNEWVRHMSDVARSRDFFKTIEDQQLDVNFIDVNIQSIYGVNNSADTLSFYLIDNTHVQAGLFETELILANRKNGSNLSTGVWNGRGIDGIKQISIRGKRKFKPVSLCKLSNVNEAFYTLLPLKKGTIKIFVKSKRFPDFTLNSELFDCAMPYFDEIERTLYYCSNNPDGYGGWDIYKSIYDGKEWTQPENLGRKINTPFNEIFPSKYYGDLSFSSDARKGKGGFDNYFYSFKDSVCVNLHPYNSCENDYGLMNINGQTLGIKGNKLVFYIEKEKYEQEKFDKDYKALLAFLNPTKKRQDAITAKSKKEIISIGNYDLLFDFDRYSLTDAHFNRLDSLAEILKRETKVSQSVFIYAHADSIGNEKYNQNLAYRRVLEPLNYLQLKLASNLFNFVPVICGELLSNNSDDLFLNRNIGFEFQAQRLKYNMLLAVRVKSTQKVDEFIQPYNLIKVDFSLINEGDKEILNENDIVFVGIQNLHKIRKGETLSSISKKYNCNLLDIKKINGVARDLIRENSYLIIPMP